ncbi:MAG: DUF1329 domain-containing protein [Alphaproteobacteria bacterium]
MKSFKSALLGSALAVMIAAPAAADLDSSMTPMGAIKAGNADGTIPAWTGGITRAPSGYSRGDHHPDPYAADGIDFTITAGNMGQYADKLAPGQKAMLERYDGFKMNVYPTRRSASFPQKVYDWTARNDKSASLTADGNGVTGAKIGVPFPTPENGLEAIWNHILRYRGASATRKVGQANVTTGGSYTMIKFEDDFLFRYVQDDFDAEGENVAVYFLQRVVAPSRLAGSILLVHETINQVREPRGAWTYNPGQRRVRKAPNIAYDNPGTAADGLRTSDNLDLFNGSPDRYDWKLVGRKEMYVPYNSYKLHSDSLEYDDIIMAGHLNPDHLRYELHRVWEVEATVKSGVRHAYAKRVFYIDEDSWQILHVDHYDAQGELWRVGEAHPINYYEVPVLWSTLDVIYDLKAGRYTAVGFDNQESMYQFGATLNQGNFTPSGLRRAGRR